MICWLSKRSEPATNGTLLGQELWYKYRWSQCWVISRVWEDSKDQSIFPPSLSRFLPSPCIECLLCARDTKTSWHKPWPHRASNLVGKQQRWPLLKKELNLMIKKTGMPWSNKCPQTCKEGKTKQCFGILSDYQRYGPEVLLVKERKQKVISACWRN